MPRILILLVSLGAVVRPAFSQSPRLVWQADLQIKTLTVAEAKGGLIARVVVTSEFGEAMAAKVEVMLPVGVGIMQMGAGCAAGPSAPGVPSLRARVICTIGNLRPNDRREFSITTTSPPAGTARRFGVIATSDTPDPKPGNNFAEKVIP